MKDICSLRITLFLQIVANKEPSAITDTQNFFIVYS